jgi:DNA adenine methylase
VSKQLPLPGIEPPNRIVNVASVPHRSPFRYPGGKTWLVPRIRTWLGSLPTRPAEFIEPFAGGAIVGLTVAFERLADHVVLVELDDQIAAVWQTILDEDGPWLAEQIVRFRLERENVERFLSSDVHTLREKALQTIVRNRVNRGGILAPGAGMLKFGEDGRGIASRWYPETLSKRILNIVGIRDRLSFIHCDGMDVLRQNAERSDAVFFIDPPYTAPGKRAGRRLYTHWVLDHQELFEIADTLAGDFLMTYENSEGVLGFAQRHGFDTLAVAMKNTHHAKMTELLVGRDLKWARSC